MRRLLGVFAVLVLAGCGSSAPQSSDPPVSTSATTTTTVAPNAAWASPAHYRFDYRPGCFCPSLPTRVEVRDGKVVKATLLEEVSGVPGETDSPTIDELLADVRRAEKEATGEVKVDYDANGVPIEASIDWIENAIDDEMTWRIENFKVLS
jgi:hypothetical protein